MNARELLAYVEDHVDEIMVRARRPDGSIGNVSFAELNGRQAITFLRIWAECGHTPHYVPRGAGDGL